VIEHLVPPAVRTRAAYGDELDHAPLDPVEAPAVAAAVAARRAEFAAGRACARQALAALGHGGVPVPRGDGIGGRGAPVWPQGVVGSITHCTGYRAAAVARVAEIATIGIDAEPHSPLPEGVLDAILATAAERRAVTDLARRVPQVSWDRLLFSAKETVYKAWYPYHHRMLAFEEAELFFTYDAPDPGHGGTAGAGAGRRSPGPGAGRPYRGAGVVPPPGRGADGPGAVERGGYTARLLVPGPLLAPGAGPEVFTGRWMVRDGLLVTAITVPAGPAGSGGRASPDRPGGLADPDRPAGQAD
jgi:4'-phosphopantetheinyl transferase EntD